MSPVATVEGLGSQGEGIVRHEGKVVFVPGALPGEEIRYRLAPGGKRFDHGVIEEVLRPAPGRRTTPCPHDHAGGCGGCSLLHATAAAAAAFKTDAFAGLLRHAGLPVERLEPPRIPGGGIAYRNRARFFVVGGGRLAYVARPDPEASVRREKVAIDRCPVLHPLVEELRAAIDGRASGLKEVEIRAGTATGERLVILEGESLPKGLDPVALDASVLLRRRGGPVPLRGLPAIHEIVAGVRFKVSDGSFFQVNTEGAEELVRIVGETAGPTPGTVLDLYAGVGLFALAAARGARRIVAVESAPSALRDLRENARGAGALSIRPGDAREALDDLLEVRDRPDVVIADPPRAGLGPEVAARICRLAPPQVVLAACEPASLVRDLPAFLAAGYALDRLIPVDQFGGTHHLEVVALLLRDA